MFGKVWDTAKDGGTKDNAAYDLGDNLGLFHIAKCPA